MNEQLLNIKDTNKQVDTANFWRDPVTWRSASTGMNQNVIGTYAPSNTKKAAILHMRNNITPYTDKRKYLDKESGTKHDYFVDVVNDCMFKIWNNGRGFVFTDSQLKEVMRILPTVNVKWNQNDECYWCYK